MVIGQPKPHWPLACLVTMGYCESEPPKIDRNAAGQTCNFARLIPSQNSLYPPLNPACPGARAHCLPFRLTDEQSTSLILDQQSLAWLWKFGHFQTLTNDAITLEQRVEAEPLHKLQPAQHKCNIVWCHFFRSPHPCNPTSFNGSINMSAGQLCFLTKRQCASHRANWSNYSLCNRSQ